MSQPEDDAKPNKAWKIALVGFPLFLILSTAGSMWFWWRGLEDPEVDQRLALPEGGATVTEVDDHLHKLHDLIGARHWETPEGRTGIRQAIALLKGTLSPQNYGFEVREGATLPKEGELWPTVWADFRGTGTPRRVVVVATPYDSGEAQIAVALGAVHKLRGSEGAKTIRFVFYPATLYRGEGRSLKQLLKANESLVETLKPEFPDPKQRVSAEDLMPAVEALAGKAQDLAR